MYGIIVFATAPFGISSMYERPDPTWVDQCRGKANWEEQAVLTIESTRCKNAT